MQKEPRCSSTLKIRVQPGSDALHRVLCVCHRRGMQILALTYADNELVLTIQGEETAHATSAIGSLRSLMSSLCSS